MTDKPLIAGVQMNPKIGELTYNLDRVITFLKLAAQMGANVVFFPECALTGYCFADLSEVESVAETIPGPATGSIHKVCRELDIQAIVGLVERSGVSCYNSSVLIGPSGVLGTYRKIHLPFLGLDRFVRKNDMPFKVHETKFGRLG